MGNRAYKADAGTAGTRPRDAVPRVMLGVLLAAFAGALALKAWDEHQTADTATLLQQSREAIAVASHVRAELVSSRARMEGLLLTGSSLDAVRRGAHLETVTARAPADGDWAQLIDKNSVRVFAQDGRGKWFSGVRAAKSFMPVIDGRGLYLASLAHALPRPTFQWVDGQRLAAACSAIDGADISVCISRASPPLDFGDLRRIAIYALLLAPPLLAVAGLLQVIARLQAAAHNARRIASADGPAPSRSSDIGPAFEIAGVIGFWRWDPGARLLTLSAQAAALLGATRSGDMTLDEFAHLLSDNDRRKVIATLSNASPLARINIAFHGVGAAAGAWFELIGGCADNVFSGAILNITDRVSAQHRSSRAEAVARAALAAHPGPFAIWDKRKRLTHWNAGFQRVFNLDKSVVAAGASYDFIMAEISKFVRIERPLGDDTNGREMLLLSDQWIRLVDRRTASDGLITVGVDISALKRQETRLSRDDKRLRTMVMELERLRGQAQESATRAAEEKARAEQASQAKGAFLANMNHEFRTPLNAITGFSEMLVGEVHGPLDERYKGYADDILRSGQHLLDIVTDVLDMARIEAGKVHYTPQPIDPADAVDSAVRMIRRRAAEKGIALSFDVDDDLPEIDGDHRAIRQMTLNLVANAIKFTDENGEISVAVFREDDWLVIRVADNGCGIAEADLPRLGQPFEQAKAPDGRPSQGTGLGLALTKSFAEMHGGYLSIESEVRVGTTVSIYLPAPHAAASPAEAAARATHAENADI